jgi:alanyl-tRNA synthetase
MAEEVIKEYKDHYKDLEEKRDFIISEMENEEKQFLSTLEK